MAEASRKHVGVLGWWSHDNQGDAAMLATLQHSLAPHTVVPMDVGFPANPDAVFRLNRLDFVLLGGGTLIRGRPSLPFDTFDTWQDRLTAPLGAVGIGVDPVIPEARHAVQAILDRARFFYVRDSQSREELADKRAIVRPDLTFARPLEACGAIGLPAGDMPLCGVNLRKAPGMDPQPWIDVMRRLPLHFRGVPFSSHEMWQESNWLAQLDPACAARFDPSLYAGLHLMIGTAFHSAVFAVQSGVPVIAIDYAPKTRAFMRDIGMEAYLLPPDGWDRLPALVEQVLSVQEELAARLREVRMHLAAQAQAMMAEVRGVIDAAGPARDRTSPRVSVIVANNTEEQQRSATLASCRAQTHNDVETIESDGTDLNAALGRASGKYVTWLEAGAQLSPDALDCLAARLEQAPDVDVLYCDYYTMDDLMRITDFHRILPPEKLYRRDVIGPCFLLRRSLLDRVGPINTDAPLPNYEFWLRAQRAGTLRPFQVPLLVVSEDAMPKSRKDAERAVRRAQRAGASPVHRAVWNVIDSDWGERVIVRPAATLVRQLRRAGQP